MLNKILELIKQRRIWAGICAVVALALRVISPDINFDADSFVNAVMSIVDYLAIIGSIVLPILSYFKPKK